MSSLRSRLTSSGGVQGRVSLSDIENRLRGVTSGTREVLVDTRQNVITVGVVGIVAFIACSYLLGRRRGRQRSTILEIRRV